MSELMTRTAQPILLVEDNPEDYEATLRMFRCAGVANPVVHCESGDDALDYLFRRGRYAEDTSPPPGLILMDLNLPGTDGREVLAEIKQVKHLRRIPVVVLTTSTSERDVRDCYASGANSYIQKPIDLEGFKDAIVKIKEFWLGIALLPRPEAGTADASGTGEDSDCR